MKTAVETITKFPDFNDEMVISISHLGFIERTPLTEIRSMTHESVSIKAFYTRDNDYVKYISLATMQSTIIFFTSLGGCYWLKVCDIPENSSNSTEYTVQKLLKIGVEDSILAFIPLEDYSDSTFLNSHSVVFCTKNGIVKRTPLMNFFRQRNGIIHPCNNGIKAINLCEGDSLVNAIVANGKNELMLASREGHAIRFNESQIRIMGRSSTGVLGLRLIDEKDEIMSIIHIDDVKTETIMFVCEKGYGIRTNPEDFRSGYRANFGVKVTTVTNKTGKVIAITTVTDDTDLIIFYKSGVINRIKAKNVPIKKRTTSCVKLIEMFPKNDQIICVLKVDDFDK